MTIILYKTPDDPNVLNKQLTQLAEVTGTTRKKEQIGTLSTDIDIECTDTDIINQCNYLYVQELSRYYWVGDKKNIVTGLWHFIDCRVDPLMSCKTELLQCEGVVERVGVPGDKYLVDPVDQRYQNPHITYTPFPESFSGEKSVILVTC